MKPALALLLCGASLSIAATTTALALPRHAPGNPRGVMDPRGVADPRGVMDPRGIADPRGVMDPRGVADPRGVMDPRGVRDPRGIADPRGVMDPRGIADPRGVFDPRGPFDPRNPHRYMYTLPAGYAPRVYGGVTYYYCSGFYYYPYVINGQTVYTLAIVRNGVPMPPPRPY